MLWFLDVFETLISSVGSLDSAVGPDPFTVVVDPGVDGGVGGVAVVLAPWGKANLQEAAAIVDHE